MRSSLFILALLICWGAKGADKTGISVSTTKLDGVMEEQAWCGTNNEVVLIRTDKNTVYRSENRGVTFKKITKHLESAAAQVTEENEEVGDVVNIIESEADDKTLVLVGNKGVMWVTTNCGATMKAITKQFGLSWIKLHPTEKTWMMASALQKCDDPDDETCIGGSHTLYLTQDLGVSWKAIANNVLHAEWSFNPEQIATGIPIPRIYAHISKGRQMPVIRTDDFFGNTTVIAADCLGFKLRALFMFVEQKAGESDVNLLVSTLEEKFNKFYKAQFPFPTLKLHQYSILDSSEGTVFLHVSHMLGLPFGHIYVSDSTGVRYSLSLKNCLKDSRIGADFIKIQGLEGIFIANAVDDKAAIEYEEQLEEENPEEEKWEDIEREETATKHATQAGKRKKLMQRQVLDHIRSFITFNKGGSWRYVTAPKNDVNNHAIHCKNDESCSLNLRLHRDTTVPFYSHKNAHGILLATGNVGKTLLRSFESTNAYLSRDGGLTWLEIAQGWHVYDMADHGGLLAMSSLNAPGDRNARILYSWNEGLSWTTLKLPTTNASIEDVFTEPDSTSQHFLVRADQYHENEEGAEFEKTTVIFNLNFESLHARPCHGEERPGAHDSDFEVWTPYDGRHGQACLMGRMISYSRRKRESECYNGVKFERPLSVSNCECTEEDYECDLGFARKDKLSNSPCIAVANISYAPPPVCPAGSSYSVTGGYRKVAGDTCQGGVQHPAIIIPCSSSAWFAGSNTVIIVLMGIIVVLLVVVGYTYQHFEEIKEKLQARFQSTRGAQGEYRDVKYGRVAHKEEEGEEELVVQPAPASKPAKTNA